MLGGGVKRPPNTPAPLVMQRYTFMIHFLYNSVQSFCFGSIYDLCVAKNKKNSEKPFLFIILLISKLTCVVLNSRIFYLLFYYITSSYNTSNKYLMVCGRDAPPQCGSIVLHNRLTFLLEDFSLHRHGMELIFLLR